MPDLNWDSLWINANLATMADDYGIIENAAIAVKDGKIAWSGAMKELESRQARQVHDAKNQWLLPGLIDCHTHMVYAGDRSHEHAMRAAGATYADIAKAGGGILSTVRDTRAASEKELLKVSEKRLQCFLAEGVTTTEIKSGYGLDKENEIKMLRVARALGEKYPVTVQTTFLGAHTVPTEFKGNADAYIDVVCDEILPAAASEKLVDAADGFCESIAFSPQQIARVFDAAKKLGLKVKLHAEQLSDSGGAELAAHYNALSADHLEYASESGIKAMAKSGTVAVLLPGAFHTLNETQKPPVDLLRKYNVPMALASDCNPGTSPFTSLLAMLPMGCKLFGLTPQEALAGVTINAARALGMEKEVGTLEVGKNADIAVFGIAHPVELCSQLSYNPCVGIIKNGVYRERDHA